MNKLLTTIVLLCFSAAANAESYVCSNSGSDTLTTYERTDNGFTRTPYDTFFTVVGETDAWILLNSWQIYNEDKEFLIQMRAINKITLDYYSGTHGNGFIDYSDVADATFGVGKCAYVG
jgi:hypothetical protein